MKLELKSATTRLRESIRKRHPARFELAEKIGDQIRDELTKDYPTDPAVLTQVDGLSRWLESGIQHIALQALLDEDNYAKEITSQGLLVSCLLLTRKLSVYELILGDSRCDNISRIMHEYSMTVA